MYSERRRKAGCEAMTAFKSQGAMRLRGKAAKNWVAEIKKEKAARDEQRSDEKKEPKEGGVARQ